MTENKVMKVEIRFVDIRSRQTLPIPCDPACVPRKGDSVAWRNECYLVDRIRHSFENASVLDRDLFTQVVTVEVMAL